MRYIKGGVWNCFKTDINVIYLTQGVCKLKPFSSGKICNAYKLYIHTTERGVNDKRMKLQINVFSIFVLGNKSLCIVQLKWLFLLQLLNYFYRV